MHYHSAQHGKQRLHRAARFLHRETQLPSSTSLPEQSAPLPGASTPAAAGSNFERMQADLKALQQQALATQQSLAQLQTRKPADPFTAIVSELPGVHAVGGTLLGVASALAMAGVLVWWYVWQRPRMQAAEPIPPQAPLQASLTPKVDAEGWAMSTAPGELSNAGFDSSSANASVERDIAFDSEAAATEVTRVRKSLAVRREARAHFLERDDATEPTLDSDIEPAPDPLLDLDLNVDELHTKLPAQTLQDSRVANPPMPEPEPEPEPESTLDFGSAMELDLNLDPWRQPGESRIGAADDSASEAIHFSIALEDYGVKPDTPTTPSAHSPYEFVMDSFSEIPPKSVEQLPQEREPEATPDFDFTITMELAQESAALELWTEARDLAAEVLVSDNAALVAQARELLERLNQLEQDAPPETNWGSVR